MFSSAAASEYSNILYSVTEHEVLFLAILECIQGFTDCLTHLSSETKSERHLLRFLFMVLLNLQ